ncbi:MAG: ornithine carbamoyltransferase [Thermoleophilia bacterium]
MSVRHFRKVSDLTADEIRWVLDEAARLKRDPFSTLLAGKTVALIFSKPSTRTRVSFSVGVHQMGGMALFLGENELQMRTSETIEDTARVLSRYVDAIVIRTFAQRDVDDLAANASVPVVNALTDDRHPCQALADILTFEEAFPDPRGRTITYLGDGNNVAASLAAAGAMTGVNVCLCTPEGYDLAPEMWAEVQALADAHDTRVWLERDPSAAVAGASALYTDVWISMGQAQDEAKLAALRPYRIDDALLAAAPPQAVVMHCLPAHRGMEITDSVMDGPRSVVFDQAENRLHAQKALLTFIMGSHEVCR